MCSAPGWEQHSGKDSIPGLKDFLTLWLQFRQYIHIYSKLFLLLMVQHILFSVLYIIEITWIIYLFLPSCQETWSTSRCPLPTPEASFHRLIYDLAHLKTNIRVMFLTYIYLLERKGLHRPSLAVGGRCRSLIVTDEPSCTLLAKCLEM